MTPSIWPHLQSLQGQTLHTVARSKPFTVATVTNTRLEIYVHDGSKTRIILRCDLDPFWQRLVKQGELSKVELATVYTFNSTYAAALLAAAPGVTATTNPIVLHYRPVGAK